MLQGYAPVIQALLGTLFTWGLTAAGAAVVFFFKSGKQKVLDGSLGFAAGVMTAASYWSLLAPAIELAENSKLYGEDGQYGFIPAAIGFFLGAAFVYSTDVFLPVMNIPSPSIALAMHVQPQAEKENYRIKKRPNPSIDLPKTNSKSRHRKKNNDALRTDTNPNSHVINGLGNFQDTEVKNGHQADEKFWRRVLLLILAITVHNIPEGLAVGVGFGAVSKTSSATFEKARNLAIGIGIQNFPEGLAVSLPLRGAGMSPWKSFWYGQLSGVVEPLAGVCGAVAVTLSEVLLPYALAFAAGAMIYVVVDDIIPESQMHGNGRLATWSAIFGFLVMMCLDKGLG